MYYDFNNLEFRENSIHGCNEFDPSDCFDLGNFQSETLSGDKKIRTYTKGKLTYSCGKRKTINDMWYGSTYHIFAKVICKC